MKHCMNIENITQAKKVHSHIIAKNLPSFVSKFSQLKKRISGRLAQHKEGNQTSRLWLQTTNILIMEKDPCLRP